MKDHAPVGLTLLGWMLGNITVTGCSERVVCGPGTMQSGNVCVIDRDSSSMSDALTSETATSGDAGPLFQPGDLLIAENRSGTDITLVAGFQACLDLKVRHTDGTTTPIRPNAAAVQVVVSNEAVVTSAMASECDVAGLVALAPGTASVELRVSDGVRSLTSTVLATVQPGNIALSRAYPDTVSLGATALSYARVFWNGAYNAIPSDAELPFRWVVTDRDGGTVRLATGVRPATRYVSLTLENPSLGRIEAIPYDPYQRVKLQLDTVGNSDLTVTFSPPNAAPVRASAPLVAKQVDVASLPPTSIQVGFRETAGQALPLGAGLPRGGCVIPSLFATPSRVDNERVFPFEVATGVGWTHTSTGNGQVTDGAQPNEICASPTSVVAVRGCVGELLCARADLQVLDRTAVESATLTGMNPSTSPIVGEHDTFSYQFCVPLRAMLVPTGGTALDVSRFAFWEMSQTNSGMQLHATSLYDPLQGRVCLRSQDRGPTNRVLGYAGSGQTAITLEGSYAFDGSARIRSAPVTVILAGTLQEL